MKYGIQNSFRIPTDKESGGKPIKIPFGRWAWTETIFQRFDESSAKAIKAQLEEILKNGGLGIPVYQGHPDVPELAAKYPDKGALGWVIEIEIGKEEAFVSVEWDRFPSKGFAYFSPYWFGNLQTEQDGVKTILIDELRSIGLVNRPRIKQFRLPNEEGENQNMNREALIQLLKLPAEATDEQITAKIAELQKKAETADACKSECDQAKADLANECKKNAEIANELNAEKTAHESTKVALANEKAEHEKLRNLKTQSVTEGIANEAKEDGNERLSVVNEIMTERGLSFDKAWDEAKRKHPKLFI